MVFVSTWLCFGQGLQKKNWLSISVSLLSFIVVSCYQWPFCLPVFAISIGTLVLHTCPSCPVSLVVASYNWRSPDYLVMRASFGLCCPLGQLPSRFEFSSRVVWTGGFLLLLFGCRLVVAMIYIACWVLELFRSRIFWPLLGVFHVLRWRPCDACYCLFALD